MEMKEESEKQIIFLIEKLPKLGTKVEVLGHMEVIKHAILKDYDKYCPKGKIDG